MLSLNLAAKRFEILDSVRGPDDDGMIDHATRLMDAIKEIFLVNYKILENRFKIMSWCTFQHQSKIMSK